MNPGSGGSGSIRLGAHQRLTVLPSDPEELLLECEWTPGVPPRTHWHPMQTEHFEVLEGELTVVVDGDERILHAGDVLDIPPRTAHGMWNAGPGTCRATWQVTPALRTEELFRVMGSGPGPVTKVSLLWRFRREIRLGTPRR